MQTATLAPPLEPVHKVRSLGLPAVRGQEDAVDRVLDRQLAPGSVEELRRSARAIGVSDELVRIVGLFGTPAGHTPPGFRVECQLDGDGTLRFDLRRDISYDADGALRPTGQLFSVDSANPYEIAPVAPLVANLTCNPSIIWDLFLSDPTKNVGGAFRDRDEVLVEIARILGPGADMSVELENPFEDVGKAVEEAEHLRDLVSEYRVVIKVPHTGPVDADNYRQLLEGAGHLDRRYDAPTTADAFRGHNLALTLRDRGFRVNFTLMFEPHQVRLALQARPYFVNAFVRHRMFQSQRMAELLDQHAQTRDDEPLLALRAYLLDNDYLSTADADLDLGECRRIAERVVAYRRIREPEGADGLDHARHALRVLRDANLPDTRLIICSMEGDRNYPDIDRMLAEPELADMVHRVVVTAEPGYLARFTSTNQVVSYQRRFLRAAEHTRAARAAAHRAGSGQP
ncbi:MAG: transaldolase [Cellulomonas sp. 73-145]|mgnify:CR=1 FL=1|uniref:transaldolase family protein n=1 Tax=Cellulomonas sp. 73-145 TaxID=1895739 RepID=UPI00092A2A93|nr:transaldolase family protein [Cellulomonas sp. 73-145]OJV57998.1 MAG: transaldolase [Cellulomonas sp. 73-145]